MSWASTLLTHAARMVMLNHKSALQAIKGYQITKFIPFNPVDKKTQATVITPSGDKLIACKGAPQVRTHRVWQSSP